MNWPMHSIDPKRVKSHLADAASEPCEHVESDSSLAYAVTGETDSFGPVTRFVLCRKCNDALQQEEAAEEVVCHDCKIPLKRGDSLEWRWYDFYAPQGDEPLVLCRECWGSPRHKARRERDKRERDAELYGEVEEDEDDRYDD